MLEEKDESHILLSVKEPDNPNFKFEIVHDELYKKGITIYPGKSSNKNTFRIANIGDLDSTDMENFIYELKNVLNKLSIKL